ncbi:MAG: DNA-directed RNA polymerase subunit beta' [Candidatus Magasanikbacteria bacterium RIFCSPHIGHO2_01_FULL_33_34]|uniref:DNA-directed RNA polymerase subunit beta' n=1 Tax=Candidatus Magasanikbacteria bacterium RIFCSPHIGHO2_01_FULL_33_34 TaxID=1798671 RepID=A0A1F6LH80_9BACT|nr:MAG: DNA-directed RNA polymerase subunit beta' [Candidatus Magasanikbacteria bacterium RIFCSPHIGHO2_01_FULL_33_34]OGH66092.1 MAG: DNA-directed RNA polymerase subunit beta' [Candidatus Magasanikbacteria bacterium RIFCSPHIGHO2_02_FULL_33_17]OGH75938.1 MAG: DNA-directed RNA polymerase subunit beta' [Candidatus Magasanikbacteria bacterium RIFCSPLOWO2_01_FULL_33_34]
MSRDSQNLVDFDALALQVASPEVIRGWSSGQVTKPETINYRTQKPEKGGLFAEEIFGPTKDWECYCGKYKKIRYKGIVCDKCGVEVTHSLVRRERMGHIELSTSVSHIWFLRSIPSKIGLVLDVPMHALEKVIYFASFIINKVDEELKTETHESLKQEFKSKKKQIEKEYKNKIENANGNTKEMEKIGKERDEKNKNLEEEFKIVESDLKDIKPLTILSENQYQELALRFGHLFEAGIGAEAVRSLLEKINLEKTIEAITDEIKQSKGAKCERLIRRAKLLKSFHKNNIKPEWMILDAIPVIPPDLRPMVALDGGRFATSDLNDLYRRVINRNNRLKRLLDLNAPEVICRNEKRMLQEAVDALIDNNARASKTVTASTGQKRQLRSLADILKGKQGRFRQNLLGKRVDYSGRSVIVVGPHLNIDECGLPKRMALELFKPFVMSQIIKREYAYNVRSASRFIETNAPEVWDILEEITKGTRVLLNRAPTLHRLGIQAFHPLLVEGKAIRLHPLVCAAFNADFDGDQMAVHVPLTEEARWEAENLMASEKNILKPATGSPVTTPQQDIALGCYYLTKYLESDTKEVTRFFSDIREATFAYKTRKITLKDRIKVRFDDLSKFPEGEGPIIETSIGRIFFNEILPDKLPYYNETITKKHLGNIIQFLLELYGQEKTAYVLDDMKRLGFKYVTSSGYSLGMDDFANIPEKEDLLAIGDEQILLVDQQFQEGLLTDSERHSKVMEIWTGIKDKVVSHNKERVDKDGSVFAMIDSGARGSWGQLGQVIGMKGLVASPSGDIIELPVKGNFKEGFDVLEFFISSHGTRKGLSDTALRTANAGYLTRRLVDVAQDVVVLEDDCGDTDGEVFTREQSEQMGQKLSQRVIGRFVLADVKDGNKTIIKTDEVVTEEGARQIDAAGIETIHVRSVLQCELPKGVCVKCYGFDLSNNKVVKKGTAVGIIAAQSIGEPGTQLTMRTFHLGGVAGGGDITQGLPRVEELFEARNPKRKAVLAEHDGKIEVEDADGKVITSPTGRKIFEGRRGQKIIKLTYEGSDEVVIRFLKSDDLKVADGQQVKKDTILFVKGSSGEEIKASHGGTVMVDKNKIILSFDGKHVREYVIPMGYKLWVKDGDMVKKGDQLTEGSIDLHELHELKGRDAVQRYVLTEIQEIYASQGQRLNDKHVEIIIKQMFSRVYIEDPGETDLLPGETVEKAQWLVANQQFRKDSASRSEARELFLGISKVSLSTQSFLSAASFQETARVLINAAINGKVDYLEGLKENVIIGRLIPVGTGVGEEKIALSNLKKNKEE